MPALNFRQLLTEPSQSSKREKLLALALQLFALIGDDDEGDVPDGAFPQKDGTGPEIYVAPRVIPSP